MVPQWHTLQGEETLLRDQILRGKECLVQVQRELAERQDLLEEWPTYETRCGVNCLPQLTESVPRNERVERFLSDWVQRREARLVAVQEALGKLGRADCVARAA